MAGRRMFFGRRAASGLLGAALLGGALLEPGNAAAWSYPQEAVRIERRLSSADAAERLSAARDLRKLSPSLARPVVEHALADDDVEVRVIAARAVVAFGYDDLGHAVVGWLLDRDARLRLAATEVLRLGPVSESIEPLGRVLSDSDERVRSGAAGALGEVTEAAPRSGVAAGDTGELRGRAATALLGHLDDPEPRVRVFVVDALAKLGDARAVLPLVSKLQDGSPEVRMAVARALGVLADARATSALIVALGDHESAVVTEVARALGAIGDPGAAPSLLALLSGGASTAVRRAALLALGRLGRESDLEKLLPLLTEPAVASAAETALGLAGARAEKLLERCLVAPSSEASAACARILAGSRSELAAPAILAAMRGGTLAPAPGLASLASTGSKDALIVALELLAHPDRSVRNAAEDTLLELLEERPDPRAAGPLLEALQQANRSNDERAKLLAALGRTGAREAAAPLSDAANATVVSVRLAALGALGFVPSEQGEKALLDALDDASGEVRRTAALSLRRSGTPAALPVLTSRFRNGAGQDRAALALALWGPLSKRPSDANAAEVVGFVDIAEGPARDSLIEALVAASASPAAARKLDELAKSGTFADRLKLAQAAALTPAGASLLRVLAEDVDPAIRAEALWGLARAGELATDRELLVKGSLASHPLVRTNAMAALAVLFRNALPNATVKSDAVVLERACAALSDPVPSVRASAVVATFWLTRGADTLPPCASHAMVQLLRRDPSEVVRAQAAFVLAGQTDARSRFELRRCQAFEVSPRVAAACVASVPGSLLAVRALGGEDAATAKSALLPPELVFVAARPAEAPAPRRPFVALEQGVVRAGTTDRRGAFLSRERESLELLELGLLESR